MRAADLTVGMPYLLDDGREAVVLDATPVHDSLPDRRKVLVQIDDETEYILPRQIATAKPTRPLRPVPTKKAPKRSLTLDDPRLDCFRPDPAIVEQYVSRKMANGQTDIEYLLACWRRRENVILVGDTQGGKTMLAQVMAVIVGNVMGIGKPVPVFTLSGSNGITDYDLFGQQTAWTDDDGVEHLVWLPGQLDLASRVGGIFLADEVSMMHERVTSSLHSVTDWRRDFTNRNKAVLVPGDGFMPEHVPVHPDLWFMATMNPSTYRGSGALNEAFAQRFRHLEWEYDEHVELALVKNESVLSFGQALREARATGHLRTPVGTSALMRMASDIERDGVDMALYCLLSTFQVDEKPLVNEIISSRSFRKSLAGAAASSDEDEDTPF